MYSVEFREAVANSLWCVHQLNQAQQEEAFLQAKLQQDTITMFLGNGLEHARKNIANCYQAVLPKASLACQVSLPGQTFSLAWPARP